MYMGQNFIADSILDAMSHCSNTVLMSISILAFQKSLKTDSETVSENRVLKIMFA